MIALEYYKTRLIDSMSVIMTSRLESHYETSTADAEE